MSARAKQRRAVIVGDADRRRAGGLRRLERRHARRASCRWPTARSGSRLCRCRGMATSRAACVSSSSGPPARSSRFAAPSASRMIDAVAGNAEGAGKLERVGHRHQAGTAGRRIGEAAAAGQRLRRAEPRPAAIDCEAEATTEAASTWASARRRRMVSGGWMSSPAACRCTCSVRVATIIPSPFDRTIPKKYHLSSAVNDFVRSAGVAAVQFELIFQTFRGSSADGE